MRRELRKGGRVARSFGARSVAEILSQAIRIEHRCGFARHRNCRRPRTLGGIVVATNKPNNLSDPTASQAGVRLSSSAVNAKSLFYPPDPTERSCFVGGTIATNASGARNFKYGATRNYVQGLKVVLASGDTVNLRRGELFAVQDGKVVIPLPTGGSVEAQLPTYTMPRVRKHASGYFVAHGMDVIDLFIGSEGTLGVIVEAELQLSKPAGVLRSVFFDDEENLLAFVRAARERSLANRVRSPTVREGQFSQLDARAIEYFDVESLNFLRQKYDSVPTRATGAIFFEQETTPETEDSLMSEWLGLVEAHQALAEESWFATNEADQTKLREFRHALPVLMNEWFARYRQRKVSTDMSVPDEAFAGMLSFYQDSLRGGDLRYTIFGHIGDNHVHVNILPRNDEEGARAWEIYHSFIRRAVDVGGTISAEHGIGKLKRDYLVELYGKEHLREMAKLKLAFDPAGILGRGNMFKEEYMA